MKENQSIKNFGFRIISKFRDEIHSNNSEAMIHLSYD
jgi:hypothetical protein